MNLTDLKQILDTVGHPVAYSHFKEPPVLPYIAYLVSDSPNFTADDKVYQKIDNVQIELYSSKKDLQAEAKLEQVLLDNEIPWESTETFIESEQLFQKTYETRLI